tara:strand:- start:300 stop:866 length:567 start_codon:yes stop_codon:yes gene_type:complete
MKKVRNVQDLVDLGFVVISKAYLNNNKLGWKHLKGSGDFNSLRESYGKILGYKLNQGKWVYAIVIDGSIIIKTGKAECKTGIQGRLGSYLAGNPAYDSNDNGKPTNASTNRKIYRGVSELLKEGKVVDVYAFPVPVEYVEKQIWGVKKFVSQQNVQEFENDLYEMIDLDYTPNNKPLWNKEKQAFKTK